MYFEYIEDNRKDSLDLITILEGLTFFLQSTYAQGYFHNGLHSAVWSKRKTNIYSSDLISGVM